MAKKAQKGKVGKAGGRRVSAKIKHLVDTGEVPNTPEGRKRAAGQAYGLERKGRLGKRGGLRKKK